MEKLNSIKNRVSRFFNSLFKRKKTEATQAATIEYRHIASPEPEKKKTFHHWKTGQNNCRRDTRARWTQRIDLGNGSYKFIRHVKHA